MAITASAAAISPARTPRFAEHRRTQPFERQDETHDGDNVGRIDQLLKCECAHGFLVLPVLNMRSMRSVMKNPPTMLLKEAATATAPRTVESLRFVSAGDDDGSHHHNRVERVGERHQRRVQQRRDALDDLKTDKPRKNEDIKI